MFRAIVVILACLMASVSASNFKIRRHSLYQFNSKDECHAIYNFRKEFLKKNCPGCKVVGPVAWNGDSFGFNSEVDFNCLIYGNYPSRKVFEAYQEKEKDNKKYQKLRAKAELNANFMEKLY